MENKEKVQNSFKQIRHLAIGIFCVFMAMAVMLLYLLVDPTLSAFKFDSGKKATTNEYVPVPESDAADFDKIENGIHLRTGFVEGDGLMLVVNNCTNCHSAKLVTQNRMSKERWLATIRWMQETQNLWDLGLNEEPIVNYLATYYAPTEEGRRKNLNAIEWYELED
ncbi:monoheme cytochrome C [uncultured Croceitalea sp.]|uniref:monoheme cytochrome C n=1 Tax=uncultured Croceitalea sp. TaxID=1798908 RepID=UPI003305DA28